VLAGLRLPDESPQAEEILFALSAESMPDLASRVRQKLSSSEIAPLDSGSATAGRFTVVTLRMRATSRAALDEIARSMGATLTVVGDPHQAGART